MWTHQFYGTPLLHLPGSLEAQFTESSHTIAVALGATQDMMTCIEYGMTKL